MPRIDQRSATWEAVVAWGQARLADARDQLESPTVPDARSHQLRGEIDAMKALLALPQEQDKDSA